MLKIWVYFGLEAAAGYVVANTLAALRKAIKAEFSNVPTVMPTN